MPRDLSAAMIAALDAEVIRPVFLYEGLFTSGYLRLHTGNHPLTWNGNTYSQAGLVMSMTSAEVTTDIKAAGMTVRLSAVEDASIALALAEVARGQPGVIHLGLLEADLTTLILSPIVIFRGRLDTVMIQDELPGPTFEMNYEHELIDLERPRERRYTHNEQIGISPGDNFLQYIAGLQDKVLRWGSTT
jgi:hypothetical protein